MILLLLLFLLFNGAQSCKDVSTDCKPFDETKFTVDQVVADINQTLTESSEFIAKYQTNLHKFTVDMESRLKADRFLLEKLLKLQKHQVTCNEQPHQPPAVPCCDEIINSTTNSVTIVTTPASKVTTPTTKVTTPASKVTTPATKVSTPATKVTTPASPLRSDMCKATLFFNSRKLCKNCSTPIYDDVNMIFTCAKGFTFEIATETRQIRCDFGGTGLKLVYESQTMSGVYEGKGECVPIPPEIANRHNCSHSCAETAACDDAKLECACLKGYTDVSAKFEKPRGSICTKCNNSVPQGTDFVMLYDRSSTIQYGQNKQMIAFVQEFLNFIDIDNTSNRFSLIEFGTLAELRLPLTPKISSAKIIETLMSNASRYTGGATNTPHALKIANDEVYSTLTGNRPRVTILFTDGQPTSYYTVFDNVPNFRSLDSKTAVELLEKISGISLQKLYRSNLPDAERIPMHQRYADMMTPDIQREVRKMREIYKADIITVYVGRYTDEIDVKMMREITSEDKEITVDNFEDLKNDILDRLQILIC